MGGGMKILAALLILGAIVTVAYWANYFVAGDVRVLPDYWYGAFEDAFPVADLWMALCMAVAAWGCGGARVTARCSGLLAASALIYLAAMDITFNVEHGLYALLPISGAMIAETWINASSLGLGIATLLMCWRRAANAFIFRMMENSRPEATMASISGHRFGTMRSSMFAAACSASRSPTGATDSGTMLSRAA